MDGGLLARELLVFAPSAALLTALAAMVPLWLALYLRCRSEARRIRPERGLGRLEEIEHDRAMLLYEKTVRRRQEIERVRPQARASWRASWPASWRAWYRRRLEFRKLFGRELDELERYARDLRTT